MTRALLVGAAVYVVVCVFAYLVADHLIFLPPLPTYRDGPGILKLETADGAQIAALHLPNPLAEYTILYSHGNAEDLGTVAPILVQLRDWGFGVFAYDYRGYGTGQGRPSEPGAYADLDAAYTYLTRVAGVSPARIIVYGRSVGSGPSVDLATRAPVGGLVVESGFMTAFRVLTRVSLFPFDRFRNIDKIRRVACPVLVMHGTADGIVPFAHGRALFDAAPEPRRSLWVEGAGHNDFTLVAGERQGDALRAFVALLPPARPGRL